MSEGGIRMFGANWRSPVRHMLLVGVAAIPGAAFAQVAETDGIAEIVVTAQKREQSLQDVPVAVTAIGGAEIAANRVQNVRDLTALAPNLTVRYESGGSGQATFSMRGLVTSGGAPGSDKGISVYIDGVYLQTTVGSVNDFPDVERIEVLKGPQGTLFGRNATGGAISVVTRAPTGEFGVRQDVSVGNYDQFRSKTRLDLPKFGPLSASVTYVHAERRGDIRNLGGGTVLDFSQQREGLRTSPRYLGDENSETVFAAARLDLIDDLDVDYRFDYTENDYTSPGQGLAYVDSPLISLVRGSQANPALLTPITDRRPKAVNNSFTMPSRLYAWGQSLTVGYALTDNLSVKNILAMRRSRVRATNQLEGSGGVLVTQAIVNARLAAPAALGSPFCLICTSVRQKERQWSNEFQLNWSTDALDLTAGLLHFDANVNQLVAVASFAPLLNGVVPPFSSNVPTDIDIRSNAAFAQAEVHVTPDLDVVGGYRLTKDRKRGIDTVITGVVRDLRYKDTRSTYLVGVNYRPTDDILTYAKYSTGFISGGQLAGVPYDAETAKSWEAGIKADLFDRRVRSNLAVFSVKYANLQFATVGSAFNPPINAATVLVNAGDARARGFEWENTVRPTRNLTLVGNVGYTDFKFTQLDGRFLPGVQFFRPSQRPKWTLNGSAQYDTEEVFNGGHLSFRADFNYRSRTIVAYSPTNNVAFEDASEIPGTLIVNGRAALAGFSLGGTTAEFAVWGRNLTNNRHLSNASGIPSLNLLAGNYERARTYGLDLSIEF